MSGKATIIGVFDREYEGKQYWSVWYQLEGLTVPFKCNVYSNRVSCPPKNGMSVNWKIDQNNKQEACIRLSW